MVPYFGFQIFSHYSNGTIFVAEFWNFSKMVPFLFVIFGTFLSWYHFCCRIFALCSMVPYFGFQIFFTLFLEWYLICYIIFALFSNGTIFVLIFLHFAQIGSIVFKATFCIGTLLRQKVKRRLNV